MKRLSLLTVVLFSFALSSNALATSLSSGLTLAAPGGTVSVPISIENPTNYEFSSIDVAIEISGGVGATPLINGYEAATSDPFVWKSFSNITYLPAPNNPLATPMTRTVLGVAGSDIGIQAETEGRIMDLRVTVPASVVPGDEFDVDLVEEFSFISNLGAVEHFTDDFTDGTLKIVTPQILSDYDCIQTNLFTQESCGDLNTDGFVDGSDFNIVMDQINALASPAAASAVPEPNLAGWAVLSLLGLLAYCRRA